MLRPDLEQVGLATDIGLQRHDDSLSKRIDRRIGHLGEQLAEIVVEQPGPLGENGKWNVVAHGSGGLNSFCGHGTQDQLQVFVGVAESLLRLLQLFIDGIRLWIGRGQGFQMQQVLLHPATVSPPGSHALLDLFVVDDAALGQIHQEHAAGTQTAFFNHGQWIEIWQDTDGQVDVVVANAGIQHVAPVEEFPVAKWDAILAINLIAMFNLTTGYFLSQRAFDSLAGGDIKSPDNIARQKRLLRKVIRAILIS